MAKYLAHPQYRPDIDGLRAIAILAVVGFHAAPGKLTGGFVGVDVFFVISGYLISSIIIKGFENKSFSFSEFYARRIRRVFPALLLVMWACLFLGWFLLINDEYEQLGKHVFGGATFVSNFILLSENNYFDIEAIFKPLLHLWSLGIEEQFYIIWPLILWAAYVRTFRFLKTILLITGLSFLANLYLTNVSSAASFYLPFTRFWELLFGAILAQYVLYQNNNGFLTKASFWNHYISLLGTLLILVGFVVISKDSHFPGWWALLPVCGSVLVILAGPYAWLNRYFYSNHLMVWFGLISYPLYLWHWPLFSFVRILESGEIQPSLRIALFLISIIIAWLTYKFIERPIISVDVKKKLVTRALVVLMIMTGLMGYFIYVNSGLNERHQWMPKVINQGSIGHLNFFKFMEKHYHPCTPKNIYQDATVWNGFVRCYQSKNETKKDVVLIGDSHAEALFVGIAESLGDSNVAYYAKNESPFAGRDDFNEIFNVILDDEDVKIVVLAARWLSKLEGMNDDLIYSELKKTIVDLTKSGKNVFLVEDVPQFPFEPNVCKYDRGFVSTVKCSTNDSNQSMQYMKIFDAIQYHVPDLKIVKTRDFFCSNDLCIMAREGILYYRDNNHLNVIGSTLLGKYIVNENPELE